MTYEEIRNRIVAQINAGEKIVSGVTGGMAWAAIRQEYEAVPGLGVEAWGVLSYDKNKLDAAKISQGYVVPGDSTADMVADAIMWRIYNWRGISLRSPMEKSAVEFVFYARLNNLASV